MELRLVVQMNWRDAALVLLGIVGLYCFGISMLGGVAFEYGYRAEAHSMLIFIRYIQPILVFPAFLLALIPCKWTTFPLWILCLSIASFPYLIRDTNLRAQLGYWSIPVEKEIKELLMVMVIPIVVQLATWLRSAKGGKQASAH